ncbi:hypothetical protein LWI28_008823 [Acer negundo]|uniref:Retrovirus-related Pol polyprotein from transposon TNT 1-94-like beta-barrel domain-containing protein n=1 Tax=Acer negundo TaxID=4023 RepID=A0AAD5I657_ACENE|nr:hypothetical protein LWI28_008823 [Acer negundo]
MEYIMSFLMGLHESFSQIRGQLLLMDPLPPINKVFALISQEEHQRKITNSISSNTELAGNMAFAARVDYAKSNNAGQNSSGGYKGQKKDHPFCTHCNIHGHTIDRCFKIHGYPPGYKSKSRANSNFNVHQLTASEEKADQSGSFGGFVQDLNPNQYQQLMSMFSTHLTTSIKSASDQDVTTYPIGICFSVSLSPIFSSNHIWIVDSGATRHICSKASAFVCIKEVKHATVTLPDHTQIPVHFSGDVKLSSMITLKNVLFVPQFKFNLISVSALVSDSHLTVKFLPDCFIIQDLGTKRMIGRGDKCEELYVLNTKILNSVSNAFVNHVSAHLRAYSDAASVVPVRLKAFSNAD